MPDVNLLVYAHRNGEHQHTTYETWLTDLVDGPEPFALSVLVAVSFVRVVTNRRIYSAPSPLPVALGFVEELMTHQNCRIVVPGPDHFTEVARLCRLADASGSAVSDAQHAAVAIANGSTWVTADRDFARFAPHGLRWQHLTLD